MSDKLFDIKNDRRLSVYLYRMGFGLWLLYILLGANFLHKFIIYRTHCAVMCAFFMVIGLSASMYYDYYHNPSEFEQKKKWLLISYLLLAGVIYFLILKDKPFSFNLF
jgi:NADH:ubiquinone oxidoreductase subunit 6 (subunit J)